MITRCKRMRKPRKKPDDGENKRKLTPKTLLLPVILVGGGMGAALLINYMLLGPSPAQQCIPSEDMAFSIHVRLEALVDGNPMDLPPNLGIEGDCTRPLHTHEGGDIHIAFSKPIKFSLADFLRLWKLDLSNYDVKIFVNDGNGEFREFTGRVNELILDSDMQIKLELSTLK